MAISDVTNIQIVERVLNKNYDVVWSIKLAFEN